MELRDRILRAAATVFTEHGFRGATTRLIAQAAGVNEISLFRHFGSKDRLLHEAVHCLHSEPSEVALPAEPRRPHAELLPWAREMLAQMRARRSFVRNCMAEVDEHPEIVPADNPTTRSAVALRQYLRALKRARLATASFDPDIAAPMFMGILFSDAMGRDVMPALFNNDPDRALRQYVDLFLRALGVEKPSRRETRPS